jgi:alkylation response protein AidB-like acyl-CoA dehydrogenase
MDFSIAEEQEEIVGLAKQILADGSTHERLRALERSDGARFDAELWSNLAQAGLVGLAVPESYGGGGLGFLDLALILEEVGRTAAAVPYLETTVLGALPIAEFGDAGIKETLLPKIAAGELIVTAALLEDDAEAQRPGTVAAAAGDAWKVTGTKLCVPAGMVANRALVSASTSDGKIGVFVVDLDGAGVERTALVTTAGHPEARLVFENAPAQLLGAADADGSVLKWIEERATAAQCAMMVGVCSEAMRLTADYTKERKQFGVAIATFQAVAHRAADAYIDAEAIRLTARQACWRIGQGIPATEEIAIAKYWACEGGQRVVHAAQHLHGGMGVDRDYPLHRYFVLAKQLELPLGGATHQLRKLGAMIAAA